MTAEEKDLIHREIDEKMQELEDTGLTRMEILFNEQKGIPLADDPVFQYLKGNRTAREMLIKAGETFTADAVIDKALRQDMEHTLNPMNKYNDYKTMNEKFDPAMHWSQKFKDSYDIVNEESYVYGLKNEEEIMNEYTGDEIKSHPKVDWKMKRKYDQLTWETEKPPTFINKPLTKEQVRKKYMRKMSKSDFTWKDTALLTQFMTKAGKIKNRYQTRLEDNIQKHLSKVVKDARKMAMIPNVGMISPTDKISLTSFYEDLEEMNKKSIDPLTGRLFYSESKINLDMKYKDPKKVRFISSVSNRHAE